MSNQQLLKIVDVLVHFIKDEEYKGYDPYDVLNSPIFKLPILKKNKLIRFSTQQAFRRIPFNVRPLLGIKKEINPVTLGLAIQAFTYMCKVNQENADFYLNEIDFCINKLLELKSDGFSGYCWGYNFDWEARYSRINKFIPTIVATGIITNGLYEYCKYFRNENVKEVLISSARFVLNDLNRTYDGNNFCFSYSPIDKQVVYNASIKGARLLSQVYDLTKELKYLDEAEKAVRFVCKNQNMNGSWAYSRGDARTWVDNFHTAYVLDALLVFIKLSGKTQYKSFLDKGFNFYKNNLFTNDGFPKYYSNSFLPIDATETAQSIITLSNFNELDKAGNVIQFGISNLYNSSGYFYYQKKILTNKTPFIRWSIGWFLVALSYYLFKNTPEK